MKVTVSNGVKITTGGAKSVGEALSSLIIVPSLFNTSEEQSLTHAANITSIVRLLSAAQLQDAFPSGAGRTTSADLFEMYSYRSSATDLSNPSSVTVRIEHDSKTTSVFIPTLNVDDPTSTLATFSSLHEVFPSSVSAVDLKVATIGKNIFKHSFKGSAGTAEGIDANGEGSKDAGLPISLRSKVTIVEASLEDSVAPLVVESLPASDRVLITMPVISPFSFDTSFEAYTRILGCGVNGDDIPLNCPLDPTTSHKCNWDLHANGIPYFFTYQCPMVVPSCLTWHSEIKDFIKMLSIHTKI